MSHAFQFLLVHYNSIIACDKLTFGPYCCLSTVLIVFAVCLGRRLANILVYQVLLPTCVGIYLITYKQSSSLVLCFILDVHVITDSKQ